MCTHAHLSLFSLSLHFSLSDWAWRFCWVDEQGHGRQTTLQQFWAMSRTAANRPEATAVGSLLWCVHTLPNDLRGRPRARLALMCVDLKSKQSERRECAVELSARQGVVFSAHTHKHTHTHTHTNNSNHPSCLSASECWARATPLNYVCTQ